MMSNVLMFGDGGYALLLQQISYCVSKYGFKAKRKYEGESASKDSVAVWFG